VAKLRKKKNLEEIIVETVKLTVNGELIEAEIKPGTTLQKFLHDTLGLTGTKEGCGEGLCGACTVRIDGKAVKSCIILALQANGKNIQTIEGLANGKVLDPIQESFLDNGAFQCGYCTPGMIMAGKSFLDETPHPTEKSIRHAMSGNLCRCTGYHKIVKSILAASDNK
jgi:aerobic carbon-monoxide dehydrogenase small subunit